MIGYTAEFTDLEPAWVRSSIKAMKAQSDNWPGIDAQIRELKQHVDQFRLEVEKHIHHNAEVNPYDFIQHRLGLLVLLARLDEIFLKATGMGRESLADRENLAKTLTTLDGMQGPLYREFIEWHGKLEDQVDIPADVIQSFADADEGRTVDFEEAMNDVPPKAD